MLYKIQILSNDKLIYDVDDFLALNKTNLDAIGIIFGSDIIGKRVLAFNRWIERYNTNQHFSKQYNIAEAIQISCGLENTKNLIKGFNDYCLNPAKICWEFKRGDLQWYLPSILELAILFNVRDEINIVMQKLNCNNECLLPKNYGMSVIDSSVTVTDKKSLGINFATGYFKTINNEEHRVVRAIAKINI